MMSTMKTMTKLNDKEKQILDSVDDDSVYSVSINVHEIVDTLNSDADNENNISISGNNI